MIAAFEYAKEHPIQVGGIAIVALGAIYLLTSSGSSGGTVSAGGPSDAQVAAGIQLASINAQSQAQVAGINGQIQASNAKAAGDYAIAKLAAETSATMQVNDLAYQRSHDENSLTAYLTNSSNQTFIAAHTVDAQSMVDLASLTAHIRETELTTAAAVDINFANNATLQHTTDAVAMTQQIISNNQAAVGIEQVRGNVSIAKAVSDSKSDSSMFGAIAGIALALL